MTVMAGAIITPALTEIAGQFPTAPDVLIKLIITMPALIIGVFGMLIGRLADQIGRKNLLVISLIIYGIGGFSGYFISDIYILLSSRAVLGLGVAGILSLATTLIGDYFSGQERHQFMGTQAAFMAVGGVVFLLMGGFLADLNWRYPFALYLSAFVLLPLVIAVLYEPDRASGYADQRESNGIDYRSIGLIYGLGFLGMLFFYIIPTQLPFLLQERLPVSNTQIGLAISTTTFTGAIASFSYGKIKRRLSYVHIYGALFSVMGIGYWVVAYASSYAGMLAGLATVGLGAGLLLPNCNLWLMELAPAAQRGRVIGGITAMYFWGQFSSPIIVAFAWSPVVLSRVFFDAAYLMWALVLGLFAFRLAVRKSCT